MTAADHWEVYPTEIDGETAVVMVDLACAELAPIAALPVLHWVRFAPPGVSVDREAVPDREALEVRAAELFAAGSARAVGSVTSRRRRELYWYAPERFDPQALLEDLFGAAAAAPWACGSEPDPSWAHYISVLLPSVTDRRRLQIARALASLAERGDQLEEARLVEYRARFGSRSELDGFLRAAAGAGYRSASAPECVAGKWRARIVMRHALDPNELERHIASLATLAEANGGSYEGWDTHSVRRARGD